MIEPVSTLYTRSMLHEKMQEECRQVEIEEAMQYKDDGYICRLTVKEIPPEYIYANYIPMIAPNVVPYPQYLTYSADGLRWEDVQ